MSKTQSNCAKNSKVGQNQKQQWVSWKSHSTSEKQELLIDKNQFIKPNHPNRTKIDTEDWNFTDNSTKAKQEYYEHLGKLNIGRWNGEWSHAGHERKIFKKNLCEILASQLDLRDHQATRIPQLFLKLDLRRYRTYDQDVPLSEGGKRDKWPLVIFCICILVCWEDGRVYYPDPNAGEDKRDNLFEHIAERLELSDEAVVACVNKLRYDLRDYIDDPKDPPQPPIYAENEISGGWGRGI